MNTFFLILTTILVLALLVSAVANYLDIKRYKASDRWFFIGFVFFVVLNRLPSVLANRSLNSDEAISLSAGLSLFYDDHVLWRSVDFFTLGPLHTISFILPGFFGFALDYSNARIVWLLVLLATFYFVFRSCKYLFGKSISQLSVLYGGLVFSFDSSFNYFYNESTSILLLAIGLYLFSLKFSETKIFKNYHNSLFYFLMGLIPYFRLQAVPIAIFLVAGFYFIEVQRKGFSFKRAALYVFMGCLPTSLLVGYLTYFGVLDKAINLYLITNLGYGESRPVWENMRQTFLARSLSTLQINYFLKLPYNLMLTCVAIWGLWYKRGGLNFFIVGLSLISIYVISKTGYSFGHYFSFLILSLPLLLGWLFRTIKTAKIAIGVYGLLCLLLLSYNIYLAHVYFRPYDNNFISKVIHFRETKIESTDLGKELLEISKRHQSSPKMVNFDWYPEIHVETGILQGSHFNVPERLFGYQVSDSVTIAFVKDVFLQDLELNKPEIILIPLTTGKSYFDFTYARFDRIPKIKAFIDQNYRKYGQKEDVEIYIHKDWE